MNWYDVSFYSKSNEGYMTREIQSNSQSGARKQILALFPDATSLNFRQKAQSDEQKKAEKERRKKNEAENYVISLVLKAESRRYF